MKRRKKYFFLNVVELLWQGWGSFFCGRGYWSFLSMAGDFFCMGIGNFFSMGGDFWSNGICVFESIGEFYRIRV